MLWNRWEDIQIFKKLDRELHTMDRFARIDSQGRPVWDGGLAMTGQDDTKRQIV